MSIVYVRAKELNSYFEVEKILKHVDIFLRTSFTSQFPIWARDIEHKKHVHAFERILEDPSDKHDGDGTSIRREGRRWT